MQRAASLPCSARSPVIQRARARTPGATQRATDGRCPVRANWLSHVVAITRVAQGRAFGRSNDYTEALRCVAPNVAPINSQIYSTKRSGAFEDVPSKS